MFIIMIITRMVISDGLEAAGVSDQLCSSHFFIQMREERKWGRRKGKMGEFPRFLKEKLSCLDSFGLMIHQRWMIWVCGEATRPNDITYWVAQLRLGYKYTVLNTARRENNPHFFYCCFGKMILAIVENVNFRSVYVLRPLWQRLPRKFVF